jgi:steroid delta-isomerase-like uncharacterized protein
MGPRSALEIMRVVVEAFNARDYELLERSVTPDFVRHDLSGALMPTATGAVEVSSFLQVLFHALPDLRLDVQDMMASGSRVTMRYEFAGTHLGDLFGIAPTGRPIRFAGINIYRFEEERIAEVWQLWDWASMLQQTGVLAWPHSPGDSVNPGPAS